MYKRERVGGGEWEGWGEGRKAGREKGREGGGQHDNRATHHDELMSFLTQV